MKKTVLFFWMLLVIGGNAGAAEWMYVEYPDSLIIHLALGGKIVRGEFADQSSFFIATRPVSRGEFERFVKATGYRTHAETSDDAEYCVNTRKGLETNEKRLIWRHPGYRQRADDPVVCVDSHDMEAYLFWLNEKQKGTRCDIHPPSIADWLAASQLPEFHAPEGYMEWTCSRTRPPFFRDHSNFNSGDMMDCGFPTAFAFSYSLMGNERDDKGIPIVLPMVSLSMSTNTLTFRVVDSVYWYETLVDTGSCYYSDIEQ